MTDVEIIRVDREEDLPEWAGRGDLVSFFHETMAPWNDSPRDIESALDYVFSDAEGKGGFLTLCRAGSELAGALAMLETGMGGYVPAHLLLFVSIAPRMRGKGLGARVIRYSLDQCDGAVKLHVEYENPAKRLYERLGFTTKYAEMRYDGGTEGV